MGRKVVEKAGCIVDLVPGSEVKEALASGRLDAAEWVGPMHDLLMEFYSVTKYCYYPGWHEPGACLELIINKNVYDSSG